MFLPVNTLGLCSEVYFYKSENQKDTWRVGQHLLIKKNINLTTLALAIQQNFPLFVPVQENWTVHVLGCGLCCRYGDLLSSYSMS